MTRWWLSFTDKTTGRGFLGVTIVEQVHKHFGNAVALAMLRGAHPGGEVQGIEVPEATVIAPHLLNRLLKPDELDREFGDLLTLGSPQSSASR